MLLWSIFMKFLGHAILHLFIYPLSFKSTKSHIELHNQSKFPADSVCSSHFRDRQKLVQYQKQSFWTFFVWFFIDNSPKWDPICTKLLPVIHNTTPLFAKLKLLWRYIIVSFISTAFVAVKLKFSKFCIPMQHPWNGPSWIFLGPYSHKYGLILLKFSPEIVF